MSSRLIGTKLKFCRLYDDDVFGNLTIRPKNNQRILNLIYFENLQRDLYYKKLKKFLIKILKFLSLRKLKLKKKNIKLKIFDNKSSYLQLYSTIKSIEFFFNLNILKNLDISIENKTDILKILNQFYIYLFYSKINFYLNNLIYQINYNINIIIYFDKYYNYQFNLFNNLLLSNFNQKTTTFNKILNIFYDKSNSVLNFIDFFTKENIYYILNKKINLLKLNETNSLAKFEKFNYRVDIGKPIRKKKRVTSFRLKLLNRHRLRYFASKMTVRQFRSYIKLYRNSKFFGMYFVWLLESRLDFILYRLNLQITPYSARQYLKHVGVYVNNKLITVPSYQIKFNDIVKIKDRKKSFEFLLFKFFKKLVFMNIPYYFEVNHRLMAMRFFFKPRMNMVFFPFSMKINRLAGLGERF